MSCFFSAPKEIWQEKARQRKEWFAHIFEGRLTYDYAKLDTFLDQVDAADIVYFHGGDTALLLSRLPDTEILKKHLAGKVVVGSSAGANMLSTNFWSSMRGVPGKGRGLVAANIMVHYGAPKTGEKVRTPQDWQAEEADFAKHVGGPVTRLAEGRFEVFVQ